MEILNYQERSGDPKIVATFDVYLGPVSTVSYPNMRVMRGKQGGLFVVRPGYVKAIDGQGNKQYGNYPEMSAEKWKSLSAQIDELLKPFLKGQQESSL